jgi:hypothetical protein
LASDFILIDNILKISFKSLHPTDNLKFNIFFSHGTFENEVDELLEFQILTRNIPIPAFAIFCVPLALGALVHLGAAGTVLHTFLRKLHRLANSSSFPFVIYH